jgi:hypothetical protein
MTKTNVYIDVNKLMEQTDYGKAIYEMTFEDSLKPIDSKHFENTFNPHYNDANPDLSIYQLDSESWWRHKDFGNDEFQGHVLDWAALHYGLDRKKDFRELLLKIATDLHLDLESLKWEEFENENVRQQVERWDFLFNGEWRKDEEGLESAYSYFNNYGITKAVLKRYGVRAVTNLWTIDREGELKKQWFPKDKVAIAYEGVHHTKLYQPSADKKFKFRYLGGKPKDFIFGEREIISNMVRTEDYQRDTLIITGGEKDVLTLVSLGYDAITLNSETAGIPERFIKDGIYNAYEKVVILFDIDETGKRQANKLSRKHGLPVCTLPDELFTNGGKDVSDYIRFGLSAEILGELIASSIVPSYNLDGEDDETQTETEAPEYQELDGPDNLSNAEPAQMESLDGGNAKTDSPSTPFLPEKVYDLLPRTLKDICSRFEDKREKDVCLLSCLTVLSSCFPNIRGIYGGARVGCNINMFISAPASAGKGVMSWSRILGKGIVRHLHQKYMLAKEAYEQAKEEFRSNKGSGVPGHKPKEPVPERLFIPANSSCSTIYEYLDANQRFGVIFDNEGDTLSSIMKNDWADFSSVIRKAFHHEHISMARRTDREHREVEKPHLSLLLSGTRNQVNKLIDSVENGLFSRFLFYDFDAEPVWRDMFGNGSDELEKFFGQKADKVLEYWIYGENAKETVFLLDQSQKDFAFDYFSKKFAEMGLAHGEDIRSSVKRACLIYYRIAIMLSTIDCYDVMNLKVNKLGETMVIPDKMAKCAFLIVDTLLKHLETVFTRLQGAKAVESLNAMQQSLYNALPTDFSWKEFLAIAARLDIGKATAGKYRRDLMKAKLISTPTQGRYIRH